MKIRGLGDMTFDQLRFEVDRGGKFVVFEYCVSILILTFKNPTWFSPSFEPFEDPFLGVALDGKVFAYYLLFAVVVLPLAPYSHPSGPQHKLLATECVSSSPNPESWTTGSPSGTSSRFASG